MPASLRHLRSDAFDNLSPHDAEEVLATARMLQRAAGAGRTQPLLRGKHFGLLSESADSAAAELFRAATVELGAQLTHIRPPFTEASPVADVQQCARVLGRLYDVVECEGIAPTLVRRIAGDAGVPVFDAIAGAAHPTARLAADLGDGTPGDNRRFVLQAVLLSTLA
jgi:ornithine carbamoyltransferase